jgi:hypothetical protein
MYSPCALLPPQEAKLPMPAVVSDCLLERCEIHFAAFALRAPQWELQ